MIEYAASTLLQSIVKKMFRPSATLRMHSDMFITGGKFSSFTFSRTFAFNVQLVSEKP
jgi:hypothetical protein